MNEQRILIDALYINSGGGKKILFLLIDYFIKLNILDKYYFLFDERLETSSLDVIKKENFIKIDSNEKERRKFYKSNIKKFNSIVCLANVPPPIANNLPVTIYFHNDLLIRPLNVSINTMNRISNFIKKKYIQYLSKNTYSWVVQTELMKNKLNKFLNVQSNNILVAPIFEISSQSTTQKQKNSFLYISNFSNHKNHKRLYKAFVNAANKVDSKIQLNLTLPKDIFKESFYSNKKYPKNLQIINHGILNDYQIKQLYSTSEYLIFPSLNESFGLPLVESISKKCKVITSNLDYVSEVVKPSLTFNPYSTSSISETIVYSIKNNLKASEIIVENKIDTFVEHIS